MRSKPYSALRRPRVFNRLDGVSRYPEIRLPLPVFTEPGILVVASRLRMLGYSVGAEKVVHCLGNLLVHLIQDVRVAPVRHCRIRVSEHLGDRMRPAAYGIRGGSSSQLGE